MENLREVLYNLKKGLGILQGSYTPWFQNTPDGRHCSLGAIGQAIGRGYSSGSDPEVRILSETALALHPELKGLMAGRITGGWDIFNDCPILYVNNHLGKEETLRIWELTIAELELRLAAEVPESDTVLDTVGVG